MWGNKGKRRSLWNALSLLAAVLSITDFTVTGLIVAGVGYFDPNPFPGFIVILSVFIATLPMTIAVVLIVARFQGGLADIAGASAAIIVAAVIANLIGLQTNLPLLPAFNGPSGPRGFIEVAVGIVGIYWSSYGWLLFLKSVVLGGFVGWRLRITALAHQAKAPNGQ